MPRIELIDADAPLAQRLVRGLRYPLAGGALATCITLALFRYVAILPGALHVPFIGIALSVIIWAATWRYAIDCMVHTADGYAEPPEVSIEDRAGSPRALLVLHVTLLAGLIAIAMLAPSAFWPALLVAAFLLPAMDMSLAFDGDIGVALNPMTWIAIVARFGAAYMIPVIANLLLALLVWLAWRGATRLPLVFATPLYGFACTYLVLLDFHWMGLLIWHHREQLGMTPEAPRLARAMGQDDDDELVSECETLAKTDPEEAAIRLRDRIRERIAPTPVHVLFRTLLRQLHRNDLLLQHGQAWIAQLCATGETRRALGLVQECREIDSTFLPDDVDNADALAQLAARIGMRALADHLARAIAQRWPGHANAASPAASITDESARS